MRYVGNVDPQLPLVLAGALEANRVVEVLGIVGIDGDNLVSAAIRAPGSFRRLDFLPNRLRFLQHALREVQRQVVLGMTESKSTPSASGGARASLIWAPRAG